jgi:preprotein translocase subunit YajC
LNGGPLIVLLLMFALLWFVLIRPQRQRQMQQQRLLSTIEVGDEVLMVGGIYGIVQGIDEEDDLIVEIAEGVHVRVARRAVGGVVKPDDDEDEELEDADEEEGVNDSEEIVSDEAAEDTAALDRR